MQLKTMMLATIGKVHIKGLKSEPEEVVYVTDVAISNHLEYHQTISSDNRYNRSQDYFEI